MANSRVVVAHVGPWSATPVEGRLVGREHDLLVLETERGVVRAHRTCVDGATFSPPEWGGMLLFAIEPGPLERHYAALLET